MPTPANDRSPGYNIVCKVTGKGHKWDRKPVEGGTKFACTVCDTWIIRDLEIKDVAPPPAKIPAWSSEDQVNIRVRSGHDEYGRPSTHPHDIIIEAVDGEGVVLGRIKNAVKLEISVDSSTLQSICKLTLVGPELELETHKPVLEILPDPICRS